MVVTDRFHCITGACAIWDIRPKRILKSILAKSGLVITCCLIAKSFWNFALLCSVLNFKIVGQLKRMLWMNEIREKDFNIESFHVRKICITQSQRGLISHFWYEKEDRLVHYVQPWGTSGFYSMKQTRFIAIDRSWPRVTRWPPSNSSRGQQRDMCHSLAH